MSKAQIIAKSIGVSITAALLVTAVWWGYQMTPSSLPCASLDYSIEDSAERMYLTEAELNQVLLKEGIYPVGKPMDVVSLHRIEQAIVHHPMVRTAECYMTPRYEMKIELTQRIPLLRVQTPHEHYLIDTDRRVMEARESVKDSVLQVNGNMSPQLAATQFADFAKWLQSHRYWRTRVDHLYVQSPQMVYIYLRDETARQKTDRVLLGTMFGYERKLTKLRTFLENGAEATQDKHYRELDLRFRGQVIGRN